MIIFSLSGGDFHMPKYKLTKNDLFFSAVSNGFMVILPFCLLFLCVLLSTATFLYGLIVESKTNVSYLILDVICCVIVLLLYSRVGEILSILRGNFYILMDCVNGKNVKVTSDTDMPDTYTYTLIFRSGSSRSVSRYKYDRISVGTAFYVIKNPKSQRVLCIFEAEKYQLSDDLLKYCKK